MSPGTQPAVRDAALCMAPLCSSLAGLSLSRTAVLAQPALGSSARCAAASTMQLLTRRMRAGATLAMPPLRLPQPQAMAALQPRSCMLTRMVSHPQEMRLWGQRPPAQLALLSLRCALCMPQLPPPLCTFALSAAACTALPDYLKPVRLAAFSSLPPALTLDNSAPPCAAAFFLPATLSQRHQPTHQPRCTALPVADCCQQRPSGQMEQRRAPQAAGVRATAAAVACLFSVCIISRPGVGSTPAHFWAPVHC